MAHFAQLDENNFVVNVIVVNNDVLLDENGKESEAIGTKFCEDTFGGKWVQSSLHGNFRNMHAGIGCFYNEKLDVFVARIDE